LDALDRVGARTVVWLNETQEYLSGGGDCAERVAAKLRALLADPARAPVLVLGTLWPEHHAALTRSPGSQVRLVLENSVIEVPEFFAGRDLAVLKQVAERDARLAWAADHANDGQVIQYLAGAPELLERFHIAVPATKALIWAAMDLRRTGHRNALSSSLLEHAASAYLTDAQWTGLDDDWLEQALADTSQPCKGAQGPVTRVRPRADTAVGPELVYRLADYLEQHGRAHRADRIPPVEFWRAASVHAHPGDFAALGAAAASRGLYLEAAQLFKNATRHGDPTAPHSLLHLMHSVHPDDPRPATWVAAAAALADPESVARLLSYLKVVGAGEQVVVLAHRAADQVPLDDTGAVGRLLNCLHGVGAVDQVHALARRIGATSDVRDPATAKRLLVLLHGVGATDQAMALADRATADIGLGSLAAVAGFLRCLRDLGFDARITAVLARAPFAHVPLTCPETVAEILRLLHEVGAVEQITELLDRDPAGRVSLTAARPAARLLDRLHEVNAGDQIDLVLNRDPAAVVALDDPDAVIDLLNSLHAVEAADQVTTLAHRAATRTTIYDPAATARLLDCLHELDADDPIAVLLDRDPAAHVALDNPDAVIDLLNSLDTAKATDQVTTLAHRAATRTTANDPDATARLLDCLHELNTGDQLIALAHRAATRVPLDDPDAVARLLDRLHEFEAGEQVSVLAHRAAAAAPLDYPNDVADLLNQLHRIGATEQVALLAQRAAANAALHHPYAVARLLDSLRAIGADEQIAVLLDRDPVAAVALDHPDAVARLLDRLHRLGAHEQVVALAHRAATLATLDNSYFVGRLLDRLLEVGATEQVAELAKRLPAAGMAGHFMRIGDHEVTFRFGREPEGTATESWDWDDLD
ncbi:MAG TPA: hypothetical protein VNO31_49375, partial [Umezawaea sp.]|nr:hypothetical protein [Umezawaea sp.]